MTEMPDVGGGSPEPRNADEIIQRLMLKDLQNAEIISQLLDHVGELTITLMRRDLKETS